MKHQCEVWSGAHGFSLAVSPASATQQAMTDAGRAGVSGGPHFGDKEKTETTFKFKALHFIVAARTEVRGHGWFCRGYSKEKAVNRPLETPPKSTLTS